MTSIEREGLEERRMEGRREEEKREGGGGVKGLGGRLGGMSGKAREVKIFVAIAPTSVRGWYSGEGENIGTGERWRNYSN